MSVTMTRRAALVGGLSAAAMLSRRVTAQAATGAKIGLLLPGRRDDGGFMQAGWIGFERARMELGADATVIDGVRPQKDLLVEALRQLAAGTPALVLAHGGQCNEAAALVAAENPGLQFVVIQGGVEAANLTSYEVLQEESAWLAGAAAALLTTTGTVGHLSGIRVLPGLKGRAGYAAGVAHARPGTRLLTTFCGEQDDAALAARATTAQARAGADIVFTMLNAGRTGAITACREAGIRQIGNVRDWYRDAPDVFVASAVADVSVAMSRAVQDVLGGHLVPGRPIRLGVAAGDAVRLALAPDVPDAVRRAVAGYAAEIASGAITMPTAYAGPEFAI